MKKGGKPEKPIVGGVGKDSKAPVKGLDREGTDSDVERERARAHAKQFKVEKEGKTAGG